MNKLIKLIDWLWLEAQLASPPLIQDRIISSLHQFKDLARLLLRPYLTIYQWQGQGEGGFLTVNYAGLGYTSSFLKSILFIEEPIETIIGKWPIWRISDLTNLSTGDIIFVEADKHLVHKLPSRRSLILPFYVYLILDLRGSWEDLQKRFHQSVRSQDLRRVRKYGYEYEVSHKDRDLEMFYHDMYLPTLTAVHGKLASPISLQRTRQYFRYGVLFLVKRDGQYVSGSLCSTQNGLVDYISIGVLKADRELMREGAQGAAFYAMVHWSNQQGYEKINFGGCWPYIAEGVFRYKNKWGSAAKLLPWQNKRLWMRVQHQTPPVFEFLKNNPCVFISEGELQVLVVIENPKCVTTEAEAKWRKEYIMPGLKDLFVCSVVDLLDYSNGNLSKEGIY